MPYAEALAIQRRLSVARLTGDIPDTLLLLEHPAVFTLGRRGSHADILASSERLAELGIEVHETNRGGLVTYHGPGQVVGYPIADLRRLAGDAPGYVTGLEETIIQALAEHGIAGFRDPAARGVWTTGGKIAAIGVAVSRGITMHGFAVNLQPNMAHFQLIDPCGLGPRGVTSAERLLGRPVDMADFRQALAFHFGRVFGRGMRWTKTTDDKNLVVVVCGRSSVVDLVDFDDHLDLHRDAARQAAHTDGGASVPSSFAEQIHE